MKMFQESHSQSGQESMVLSLLDEARGGSYLEIGAWDGIDLSNTYLLEKEYGWKGVALDIERKYVKRYKKTRSNPCIHANALETDYVNLLEKFQFPEIIDYLQLDIEPAHNTYACLLRIPFDKYKFKIITYEHDLYASEGNQIYKDQAYELLTQIGYSRIASNVQNLGNPFEDWYVLREYFSDEKLKTLKSDCEFSEHFEKE
jgi:hypothetical protein